MKYLIILIMCLLATSKVSLQTSFSKGKIKNLSDALLFNGLIFLISAILFCKDIPGCNAGTLLYSTLFGIFTVIFQIAYTKALAVGNVSLTVMTVNLSMVIPIILSAAVYNEQLTVFRIIGSLLTCLSFILGVDKGKNRNLKRWFIPAICAFSANGGISVVQKMFGKSEYVVDKMAFVSFSYIVAAILTMLLYLIFRRKEKISFSVTPKLFIYTVAIGVILAVFQAVNTYAVSVIEGTFLFPTYSGGSIICTSLCGIFIFKDKLNIKQKISLALGIIAVIIMNF